MTTNDLGPHDPLETQLRSWAASSWAIHADDVSAENVAPMLSSARPAGSLRTQHKIRSVAVGAVALGCVAVAVGILIGLPRVFDSSKSPALAPAALPSTHLVAEPGQRLVTVHGLTVSVPETWRQQVGSPCSLKENLVMLPVSAEDTCGRGRAEGVSTVQFFEGDFGTARVGGQQQAIQVSGISATRVAFSDVVAHYAVVYVPSLQVSIEIGTPTTAATDALAATLQVAATDVNGCASHTSGTEDLTALGRPERPDAAGSLIPAGPSAIVLCRYQDGWLEQAATLPAAKIEAFVSTLNALPAGLSTAPDRQGGACRSSTDSENLSGLAAQDSAGYLIQASYPSGPALTVLARLGLCGDLGASNGSRTAQRTSELVSTITALVGDSQGYPPQAVPA